MRINIGDRFNRLVVVADEGMGGHDRRWRLRCDCGAEFVTDQSAFVRGLTKSCGCLKREQLIRYTKEHKPYLLPRHREKKERVAD